ncbi:MAG: sigma-54 dependent transcriptional regulator [Thermoanaerobaculia bacterium]
MKSVPKIAVIDDDPGVVELIRSVVENEGWLLDGFEDGQQFLDRADLDFYDVILTDLQLPGLSGLDLLREIQDKTRKPRVVIITGHASVPSAVTSMKEGAVDYLVKPFAVDQLVALLKRLTLGPRSAGSEPGAPSDREYAVGRSPAWLELLEKARRVAERPATVLIRGETGTGKEVLARYISSFGPRAGKPCVTLNCATLPEHLIESELFGHVRGAFTGATLPRRGLFEEANGGTLFLDEVGTLPLQAQAKLLRAIEEHQVRKVGENKSMPVDARILAATNLDLEAAMARREFREDLYFRISVVTLWIPPLRERTEDIPMLATHFLEQFAGKHEATKRLSASALDFLSRYSFPGNVRELKHALEQACAFSSDPELHPRDFPFLSARAQLMPSGPVLLRDVGGPRSVTPELLKEALARTNGNRIEAARHLGISRSTLYRLMGKSSEAAGPEIDASLTRPA